jgi:L-2,4-diaminobutyric acid acetyltransferase
LVCDHHSDTSIVYEENGAITGCVTGYMHPQKDNTLFIWQVAVHDSMRQKGLAGRMLDEVIHSLTGNYFLETTITPSNVPSQKLFRSFAHRHLARIEVLPGYPHTLFEEEGHESEELYRIGPLMGHQL